MEETVVARREIPITGDVTDAPDTGEYLDYMLYAIIEGMNHFKWMTVKQNAQDRNGGIYISEVHTNKTSEFKTGDKLMKSDGEPITDLTEHKQRLCSFHADANGRRCKVVTIQRTELSENGARKIMEMDVELIIIADDLMMRVDVPTSYVFRQLQQYQKRHVQRVNRMPDREERVFIKTNNEKYLTVRNAAIIGDTLGSFNQDAFIFHLVPMVAAYGKKYRCFRPKVVICCKIRWNSYWVKMSRGRGGEISLDLSTNDADDHTTVFKRRRNSNGDNGTHFESLLFRNTYLLFDPKSNKVTIRGPNNKKRATVKNAPPSTKFYLLNP